MRLGQMRLRVPAWARLGCRSVAAVEFAMVAPVLLILFLGTAEISLLYRTESKLNTMVASVAKMVSLQASPIVVTAAGSPSLSDICTGATYGLQPFPPRGLTLAIASVTTKTVGAPSHFDIWEADSACSGAATAIGATTACALALDGGGGTMLPANGGAVGDNIIIVRATLSYPGVVGLVLGSAPTFTQTAYARWDSALTTTELICPGAGCTVTSNLACS